MRFIFVKLSILHFFALFKLRMTGIIYKGGEMKKVLFGVKVVVGVIMITGALWGLCGPMPEAAGPQQVQTAKIEIIKVGER